MLMASFAATATADGFAARFPAGLRRLAPTLLIWADSSLWPEMPVPLVGLQGDIIDRRTARLLAPDAVAALVDTRGDAAFADWAPAFRIAWMNGPRLDAAADHGGLGHWFTWAGDGIAAIASRAATIARHFGLGVDTAAMGGLALTGAMVGLDSAIAGVGKLAPRQIASIAGGRIELRTMPPPSVLAAPEDAVAATMTRLLAARPETEIELSGGWDSRWMLAGVPRDQRAAMGGFTIGSADDADVRVACMLADDSGMRHEIVDLSELGMLDGEELRRSLAEAAFRDDFGGNPLDRVGINLINARRQPISRFSGQNGEIMRGFYAAGQPLDAPASAALAARIVDWRIISNDLVGAELFDPEWLADTRATIKARLTQLLVEPAARFGDALDRFYLEQRMHRWCGTAVSATLGRRPVLLPFFDADFLALALATPAVAKAGSRFAARDILRLDPGLAKIRLASGLVPAGVANGGVANEIARACQFAGKAASKVLQQLARRDAATARSQTASTLVMKHKIYEDIAIDRLLNLGIFSEPGLEKFARGTANMTRSNIGFTLNTSYLLNNIGES